MAAFNLNAAAASNGLAPLDSEAQRRKDEAALVKGLPVIAIGGHGSTLEDPFFPFIDKAAPGAHKMPLRGTGHGLAGLGVGNAMTQIKDALRTNPPASLFIGNSIGGPLLYNAIKEVDPLGTNTQRQTMYIDPPNLKWYQGPPRWMNFMSPTARTIQRANDAGIASDPNTINLTGGRWLKKELHSPWAYTNTPGNPARVAAITQTIQNKASGTNTAPQTPR